MNIYDAFGPSFLQKDGQQLRMGQLSKSARQLCYVTYTLKSLLSLISILLGSILMSVYLPKKFSAFFIPVLQGRA